jgi:hypothetical protein
MLKIITLLVFLAFNAKAMVTVSALDCPIEFEGRVQEVIEDFGGSGSYQTNAVIFKTLTSHKGDISDSVSVEVLKYGPMKFEVGDDYRVQLRAGRLCSIEAL